MTSPRDTDLSGCPMAWNAVPLLPPQGQQLPRTDRDGSRPLYRVKLHGQWFLIRPLPRGISVTDTANFTRVLADLEELEYLAQRLKPPPTKPKANGNKPKPTF